MIKAKRFLIIIFISILVFTLVPVAIIIYVDPFINYHEPQDELKGSYQYEQLYDVYWKMGQVKHATGNAIWVGSSLSTHFNKEQIDSALSVDCSTGIIASGRYNIYEKFINLFMSNNETDTVFYEFQPAHLYDDYDWSRIPEYMETDSIFDDSEYLFNKDVFKQSLKVLKSYIKNKRSADKVEIVKEEKIIDENAGYGVEIVANTLTSNKVLVTYDQINEVYAERKELAYKNIDTYIIPMIKNNPNVKFVFFDPPCSVVSPYVYNNTGYLDIYIDYQKSVISYLLSYGYDNVEFYFLQDDAEFCTNLEHYMDEGHYNDLGQKLMVESIANKKHIMTLENIDEMYDNFRTYVINYELPFLKTGFYGDDVVELQDKLKSLGYVITEEGYLTQTEMAVRDFQGKNGLEITGVVFEKEKELLGI